MPGMAKPGPDGHLWVTDPDESKVVLFALLQNQRQHEIATQDGAHAVAFSDDGRRAYVTNQMAASVSVVDVARQRAIRTICVGNKPNGLLFRSRPW
jgi:YVTN family beta-propeller protein